VAEPDRHSLEDTARQFGENARSYAVSRTHTEGYTRLLLLEHLEAVSDEALLDVGIGAGGFGVAAAPYVASVTGLDLAQEMLAATRLAARRAERENVRLVRGDVHQLPFADRSFDLVVSRMTPHHFRDIRRGVAEMARVVKRGGRFGIADGTVPDDRELDDFINRLDTLHDPTTVRNYSAREWRAFAEGEGLRVDWVEEEAYDLAEGRLLSDWMARSSASSAIVEEARRMLLEAPARVREYMRARPEGDDVRFDLPKCVMVARRVG